ncbi:MAG: PAS domain-containing sensor histidine kinase, partial [Gemmatimonadaceae bacterium]
GHVRSISVVDRELPPPHHSSDRDLGLLDLLARQTADWIEHVQAEGALRDGNELFRSYFELGLIGAAITSPNKGCLAVNDRLCEILGYPREELLATTWSALTHPDDLADDVALFERISSGDIESYSLDKRWIRKDGNVIDSTISVKCLRRKDGSVDCFVALVQDITEHKRAEEALRQSEARYRALISQVKDFAIFSTNERGVVTTWNEGCQQVLGYSQQEFIGLDVAELFTSDDRAADLATAELQRAAETGAAGIEHWMIAHGGRRLFAMGTTTALRNSCGDLTGFSTVLRDVTQMKLSQDELVQQEERLERLVTERTDQLQKTTERLRLSERMASLGTLAAGLGHDMGNLLLPLDVRLKLLLQAELPPDLRELVVGIQTCTRYFQQLSNGLRLLSVDPLEGQTRAATELGAWWSDVGTVLRSVLPRGVQFEHSLPGAECWVAIGRAGLTQSVFNLVQNAADALRDRGSGRVTIGAEHVPNSAFVAVRVADDGPGMTEDVMRHCMDPSFSTKARAVSSGLGLAFVQALVSKAGGRVEIDSRVGSGTTVSLVIPGAVLAPQVSELSWALA